VTASVRIPGPLRPFCDGKSLLVVEGATTVAAAIGQLPVGARERILDEQGRVRQHVNVFVGPTDIRETGGLATPLCDGVSVFVIPAVSGGNGSIVGRDEGSGQSRSTDQGHPGAP